MDDPMATATMIEEQVSALSGFSVELMEDLQKWTKAYKDDKGHVIVYAKLRQAQKYGDYYLTPSGLTLGWWGVNRRSLRPSLCDSKSERMP